MPASPSVLRSALVWRKVRYASLSVLQLRLAHPGGPPRFPSCVQPLCRGKLNTPALAESSASTSRQTILSCTQLFCDRNSLLQPYSPIRSRARLGFRHAFGPCVTGIRFASLRQPISLSQPYGLNQPYGPVLCCAVSHRSMRKYCSSSASILNRSEQWSPSDGRKALRS